MRSLSDNFFRSIVSDYCSIEPKQNSEYDVDNHNRNGKERKNSMIIKNIFFEIEHGDAKGYRRK